MLIGQTSSSWARRRMLRASRPSAETTRCAASRMRSRESRGGCSTVMYDVVYAVHIRKRNRNGGRRIDGDGFEDGTGAGLGGARRTGTVLRVVDRRRCPGGRLFPHRPGGQRAGRRQRREPPPRERRPP